jgi:putative transposase
VLFALLYLLVRRALRLTAGSASDLHNDIEIMVLRHQLAVLTRQVGRPRLRRRDRLLMAVSRVLPRPRWSLFVVRPQTLLRWHRELVRRTWTDRRNVVGGRPPLAGDVGALIVRMARENLGGGACGSGVSWPSSGSGCPRRRSARCCGEAGWGRHRGGRGRPGGVPAQPGTPDPGHRLLHRRVHLAQNPVRVVRDRAAHQAGPPGWSDQEPCLHLGHQQARNLSFDLTDAKSFRFLIRDRDAKYAPASTRCSQARASGSSSPRSGRRGRTPSPNDGSGPSGPSAWTGRWCSAADIWSGPFGPTSPTTTPSGPTAVWICGRRTRGRIRPASLPIACVSSGGMCWAG